MLGEVALAVLHDKYHLFLRLKDIDALDDVLVVQLLHQFCLCLQDFEQFVYVFIPFHALGVYPLHSHNIVVQPVCASEDPPIGS